MNREEAKRKLFEALRVSKEAAIQVAAELWFCGDDGVETSHGEWEADENGIRSQRDGLEAEFAFVGRARPGYRIEHDFITDYPSVMTLYGPVFE